LNTKLWNLPLLEDKTLFPHRREESALFPTIDISDDVDDDDDDDLNDNDDGQSVMFQLVAVL